jgi:hypothetical protein
MCEQAYRVSQSKHAVRYGCCEEKGVLVGCCGCHCCQLYVFWEEIVVQNIKPIVLMVFVVVKHERASRDSLPRSEVSLDRD